MSNADKIDESWTSLRYKWPFQKGHAEDMISEGQWKTFIKFMEERR